MKDYKNMGLVEIVRESFELYREKYSRVIFPFIGVLAVSMLISLISIALDFVSEPACKFAASSSGTDIASVAAIAVCTFPSLASIPISTIFGIIIVALTLSAYPSFRQMVHGKKVEEASGNIRPLLFTSFKIWLARAAINALLFLPVIVFAILYAGELVALKGQIAAGGMSALLASGTVVSLIAVIAVVVLVGLVVKFFIYFFEQEVVLGKKGIFEGLRSSIRLVSSNAVRVFTFILLWFAITIGLTILMIPIACIPCLGSLAIVAITVLLIEPVRILSAIMLWQQMVDGRKEGNAYRSAAEN